MLRQEDAASADSLNRKIGTNAANITTLDSRVNNLNAANNNRTDSIAQVLRQEDAASADSLNRKIGTNAANITTLDSRVNNLNAANNNRTDSIAQVLRQEDAASADSLNRKFGNYLRAADETKTLAQVLSQGNDADNKRIVNLAKGQSVSDAANLQNVSDTANALRTDMDTRIANRASHNLSDVLAAGNNGSARQIKNIADPTENQDAVTLKVLRDSIDTLRNYINRVTNRLESILRCYGLSTTGSEITEVCDSLVWMVGGQNAGVYRESGTFIHTFTGINAQGCDSTIVLHLTVNNSSSGIDDILTSPGYIWIDGNAYYRDTNNVVFTLRNANAKGCDSIVTLHFRVFEGSLPSAFTVNANNKKIHFSKGNLQYRASTDTWRFAEDQWTFNGANEGNLRPGSTQSNWMDLFGWGTSGWDNGQPSNNYLPWTSSDQDSNYNAKSISLTGDNAQADWGVHNPISNGGNVANVWRTLTSAEWKYILFERNASTVNGVANARFTHAKVNGKGGLILFPDNYIHPDGVAQPEGINLVSNTGTGTNTTWQNNNYSGADWTAMERAGVVFLPAAGYRKSMGTVKEAFPSDGGHGRYWASTYAQINPTTYAETVSTTNSDSGNKKNNQLAGYLYFGNATGVQIVDRQRSRGCSVRLVIDVE